MKRGRKGSVVEVPVVVETPLEGMKGCLQEVQILFIIIYYYTLCSWNSVVILTSLLTKLLSYQLLEHKY